MGSMLNMIGSIVVSPFPCFVLCLFQMGIYVDATVAFLVFGGGGVLSSSKADMMKALIAALLLPPSSAGGSQV